METYFVTGSTGYIGAPLTSRLSSDGHRVVALSRKHSSVGHGMGKDFSIDQAFLDLEKRSYSHLEKLGVSGSTVIDLAWDFSNRSHSEQTKDHVAFAKAVTELGAARLVVPGTLFELGFDQGLVDETSPRLGDSEHGKAKTDLFHSLTDLLKHNQSTFLWPRIHYVFGNDSSSRSVFGRIERSSKPFVLNPRQGAFDFIQLDKLVSILIELLKTEGSGAIDIGSGHPQTFHEVVSKWLFEKGLNPTEYLGSAVSGAQQIPRGTWPRLKKLANLLGEPK